MKIYVTTTDSYEYLEHFDRSTGIEDLISYLDAYDMLSGMDFAWSDERQMYTCDETTYLYWQEVCQDWARYDDYITLCCRLYGTSIVNIMLDSIDTDNIDLDRLYPVLISQLSDVLGTNNKL